MFYIPGNIVSENKVNIYIFFGGRYKNIIFHLKMNHKKEEIKISVKEKRGKGICEAKTRGCPCQIHRNRNAWLFRYFYSIWGQNMQR